MLNLFLIFFSSFLLSKSAAFKCESNQTIQQPDLLNETVYYPFNTTDAQTYDAGQSCGWKIIVKPGYSAYLAITAKTPSGNQLIITDSIQKASPVLNADSEPYFFLNPGFSVQLKSTVEGTLLFRISWAKIPDFIPQAYNVKANGEPVVLTSGNLGNATVITADTKVSLVALPPSMFDFLPFLRSCMIFDGPTWNSTYLGSLYDVALSGVQLVSSGNQLTLYQVFISGANLGDPFILQDYFNTKQYVEYKGIYCVMATVCTVSLNAQNGPSAAVSIHSENYLQKIDIPKGSTIKAYYGALIDSHVVGTYNSESTQSLPQKFGNLVTTFTLDSSSASIQIALASNNANWEVPYNGRKGFITSKHFATNSSDQNVSERFTGNDQYNFTTTVMKTGLTGNASLQVSILRGQNAVYNQTFSQDSNNIPKVITAQGNTYSVEYHTNGENTAGVYLEFEMDKVNSSAKYYEFFIVLLVAFRVC